MTSAAGERVGETETKQTRLKVRIIDMTLIKFRNLDFIE